MITTGKSMLKGASRADSRRSFGDVECPAAEWPARTIRNWDVKDEPTVAQAPDEDGM
jgi:hypothetical protein